MDEDWDNVEITLCQIRECFVYKIPPRQSSEGYRCQEWENNFIWKGRLKVVAKGPQCTIVLEDPKTGELFANAPVDTSNNQTVEPVLDSSRYFVLRIENGAGQHAFIGLGFAERNEAFDFNVALQDHNKSVTAEKEAEAARLARANEPALDLGIPQGQTISVSIKGAAASRRARPAGTSAGVPAAPANLSAFKLPPPPGHSHAQASPSAAPQQARAQQPASASFGDLAGLAPPAPAPSVMPSSSVFAAPGPSAGASNDLLGDFGDFVAAPSSSAPAAGSGQASSASTPASGSSDWVAF